jgi:AcrR family transcriptional regulator
VRTASTKAGGARQLERRREHKKLATRRQLLLAARKLFGETGLYESRIEDMTDRAGIAKGTLYLYFSSKEGLILAVAASALEELDRLVDARARGARSFRDLVGRIVEAHLDFYSENPDLMKILHQVRGMLKFNRREWRPLRGALEGYLRRLARRLAGPGARPLIGGPQRRILATLLFGAVSGVASVHAARAPRQRARDMPRGVTSALVRMALAYVADGSSGRIDARGSSFADPIFGRPGSEKRRH